MVLFDTNMILRYLLNDDTDMADAAERYITAGASVTIEVMAEAVYVLKRVYQLERRDIADLLTQLLDLVGTPDKELLLSALDAYAKHGLDFVDCILLSYHNLRGYEIATFDQKLLKRIKG